ncbi:MAG: bifunctional [glutamate--ammonia ligase]-adenylyl-L-tyrosine phosphorylase/[glutamate--ammonia-ligase] adenylyltransferase [Candidatus Methylomirabilis sp.]|nr:bifunctional [glutamate--ammonia ligase]-adenylyl-L-tyrosine phosphorylase/[glutamate--ammonia-ligase] adenylyltransferase [Deltaproteobacteria bacterium]
MIGEILSKTESEASLTLASLGYADGSGALRNLKILSGSPLSARLDAVVKLSLEAPSPDAALNNLEGVVSGSGESVSSLSDKEIGELLFICGSSSFLSGILARNPDYAGWLFREALGLPRDAESLRMEIEKRTRGLESVEEASREIRLFKQKEYLRIGSRDLLRVADLKETTRELSDLASACLEAAVAFSIKLHKRTYGAPLYEDAEGVKKEAGFVVIGMGKLGGRELNFSSDIDILYIYSSDKGETAGVEGKPGSVISLHAFFVKVSMLVTKLISNVTDEGFAFRVDLDLRPEGRSGDIANSLRSAEVYYESWGQPWERAAMIKARPVAGFIELGEEFLSMIRPFVYRKYLDFTAIDEIKTMKEKIDLSLLRRNPDAVDVKLGAGGIREIEFFCQALQLIHAGKDPLIRERNTLNALLKLKEHNYVRGDEAERLSAGYSFLRDLEHRIQIIEGRQSQAIPASEAALERLARMMGFRGSQNEKAASHFWDEYRRVTSGVHEVFRSLFYRSGEAPEVPEEVKILFTADLPEEEAQSRLRALGFCDPAAAYANLKLLRDGPPFARLSSRARLMLQRLAPMFLQRAAGSPDPDKSLAHLERFISSVGARTTFYSLLYENPRVLEELMRLFGTSVFLSRDLIEHPESLDILLSNELSIPYKRREEIAGAFLSEAASGKEYEDVLDGLRRLKSQELFRIGLNDVGGALTPRQVSSQISFIAEAALDAALKIAAGSLRERYGDPPESGRFAVIGMGKLGGRELIYGSDLDIVFVYSGNSQDRTSGPKDISLHEYYVKLGQRMISALTLRTREGFVFNVDARLRPSGSAGPLVVSEEALYKYHSGPTLVWERQALTRARAVAGDLEFGRGIVSGLWEVLYSKPLTGADIEEMLRIRKRMEVEIAKEDAGRYNLKTGAGGIVDVEFLVQALQLRYGSEKNALRTPYTQKALLRLKRGGFIPEDDFRFLSGAWSFMRLIETRQRIVHDRPEGYLVRGSEELTTLARRTGYSGSDAAERLLKDYARIAERVRDSYSKSLEGLKTAPPPRRDGKDG